MLKKTTCKFMLGFSLSLFLFCIGTTSVYAKNKVTSTLDLTSLPTTNNLNEEGWSWDASSKTLTLDGVTLEITDEDTGTPTPCINFRRDDNITIIFKGENNLVADRGYVMYGQSGTGEGGTITLKGEENTVLNLSYKRFATVGGGTNNGMTVGYPENFIMESGTVNSKGTMQFGDTFYMKGGNFNIDAWDIDSPNAGNGIYAYQQVNISGGNLNVKSKSNAIRVPGSRSESDKKDGVVISGGNVSLISKEEYAIATGHPSSTPDGNYTKNVIINGGNITLGGENGIYVYKGDIVVSKVDSSDVSNVRQDVLKVADMEGNEIICPEADYSKVDEAIDKANALNKDDYKDFSEVENAINSVERNKYLLEQSRVNAMAYNINNAIANLKSKYEPVVPQKNVESVNADNPNTYDGVLKYIIYFGLSVVGLGFSILFYKKKANINY